MYNTVEVLYMKRSGVYQIKCIENEKIYIGQTIDLDRRLYDHLRTLRRGTHHNHYLQRAFDKYGEKSFEFSVLQECSIDDLDKVEKEWIARLNSMNPLVGYNLESGGNPGKEVSEETKEKKRGKNNPMFGKKLPKEHIDILRSRNRGLHTELSEEDVASIKERLAGGEKVSRLASEYKLTISAVNKIKMCKNWGYVRSDLNESLISLTKTSRKDRDKKIRELNEQGESRAAISKKVGCTPATVARVLGYRSEYYTDSGRKANLKKQVVDDFLNGVPKDEIVKKYGITSSVYVSMISQDYNKQRQELKDKAISMRKSGMMVKDIAKDLGFARVTIAKWTKDI